MLSLESKEEERKPNTPFWKLKHKVLMEMVARKGSYDMQKVLEETEKLMREGKNDRAVQK